MIGFLRELRKRPFLRYGPKSRWSHHLFHHASLGNAVSILECGSIYSRNRLAELDIVHQESAALDVIERTEPWVQDHVRFYFRPRTPTQYRMEGIRPRGQRWRNAHCPVPIFFVFDIDDILTREGTMFSEGSLAGFDPVFGSSARELEALPFEEVYHDGYYDTDAFPRRTYHKNAEVIVPDEVDVEHACGIYCRSDAEKHTLLDSLPPSVRTSWEPHVYHDPSLNLYFDHWTFVEEAYDILGYTALRFNPETRTPGPFDLSIQATTPDGERTWTEEREGYLANDTLHIATNELTENLGTDDTIDLSIHLDGDHAYRTMLHPS